MSLNVNQIICGEAKEVMSQFPDESINCCISSPPYWSLRDYGVAGQLGLEPTFEEYIDKLCDIYDEVKRVLRKDGCVFVNLGDTYSATRWSDKPSTTGVSRTCSDIVVQKEIALPDKCLCLIPQRFAIEMVNRGWILRNVIIWHKPNPMPSSAKDRFTVDYELVFFMVRQQRYFFEPQYEPQSESTINHAPRKPRTLKGENENNVKPTFGSINKLPLGRNKRTVWTIPTQATPEAHFATFPEELVRPMVKAGCPRYVCKKCGKARRKVYDIVRDKTTQSNSTEFKDDGSSRNFAGERWISHPEFKDYTDCGCGAGFRPGIVLDPFVARVAA